MQGLKLVCLDCKKVSLVVTVAFSRHVSIAREPWKTIQISQVPKQLFKISQHSLASCLFCDLRKRTPCACQSKREMQISISTSANLGFWIGIETRTPWSFCGIRHFLFRPLHLGDASCCCWGSPFRWYPQQILATDAIWKDSADFQNPRIALHCWTFYILKFW